MKAIVAAAEHTQRKIDFRVRQFLHTLPSVDELAELDEMKSGRDRLIVALDVGTRAEAISLALELAEFAAWMKIGLQLFTAEGPDVVRAIRETGARVFLDLKLHDIPNTVARAVESAARLEAEMLTLHLSGGSEMVRAAVSAAPPSLLLLGVTVLTSENNETLWAIGIADDVDRQVTRLAKLGVDRGIRGLVTSAGEISAIRNAGLGCGLTIVVPGIRPQGSEANDQKRTMGPREAMAAGADYLVVGRPITGAADPKAAAQRILEEIDC
jgi:orotidine-5'-phosphate decarboxylase